MYSRYISLLVRNVLQVYKYTDEECASRYIGLLVRNMIQVYKYTDEECAPGI